MFYETEMLDGNDMMRDIFSQTASPFGTLPGYETNLGVAAVPTVPISGYVYSTEMKKWVLHATQGGTCLGGGPASSTGSRRQGG